VRAALSAGFVLLLLLAMLEPQPSREHRPAPPPPPQELALSLPVPAPAPIPAPPDLAPSPPRAAAVAPLPLLPPLATSAPAPSPPAPEEGAGASLRLPPGDARSRLSGDLPPPERAPAAAAAVPRSPPVPPIELVRPLPVAFPAPLVRRPRGPRPALTVIIDDLGLNGPATRRTIRLPGPLTLAFLPYGEGTPELAREAKASGHEVFLHLAMEPLGNEDPGPMALLSGLGSEELRRRLHWALGRVPGASGVNNHMGSRLTADPRAMAVVMDELGRLGLPFVDSMTTGASVAARVALEAGVPTTARDLFLDNDPVPAAILAQLERAERLARRTGSAVAIGHPYPATLQVLADWLPRAVARGLVLVPATAMIELRGCAGELLGRGGCLLRASGEPDTGEALPGCAEADCRPDAP
jgi:polysaccharide deacetylase 2 family uncharacterized protein YibQ